METLIGVVLGVIATVLVSRYYFLRSFSKALGIHGLLDSQVFSGIAPDVRADLNFRFKGKEVTDLQQIAFLVANDGERAISNIIEPLSFVLPPGVEILDASIIHKHPETIRAKISHLDSEAGARVELSFPLLNRGDFFVVKLLLSGEVRVQDLTFSVVADDLPPSLRIKHLPFNAIGEVGFGVEWGLALAALFVLLIPTWLCYALYLLWLHQPALFPYPWQSFSVTTQSLVFVIPAMVITLVLVILGLSMLGAAFFHGEFPPRRGPRFPLPKELRSLAYGYRSFYDIEVGEQKSLIDKSDGRAV